MTVYRKIVGNKLRFAPWFSPALRHLLRGLLQSDITRRLGAMRNGALDIKVNCSVQCFGWLGIPRLTPGENTHPPVPLLLLLLLFLLLLLLPSSFPPSLEIPGVACNSKAGGSRTWTGTLF